ncbi:MAG: hypothetical protein QOF01_2262 [Thermomicrobiales bacterium]|nr:hypothetical protein [Thermomicrobiales bacterium]
MRHLIAFLLLAGTLLPSVAARPAAAASLADLRISSADVRTGESLVGACFVIVDWSEEGCDENGDGDVTFQDVAVGLYTVTMTRVPSGYLPVGDFPIAVQEGDGQVFGAFLISKSQGDGQFDIALRALGHFSNDVLTGACFLLYGGSIEGCDENNDGRVEFADVRAGTYLALMTRAPAGHRPPDAFWVDVTAKGSRVLSVHTPEDYGGTGLPNVTIVNVDDATGEHLTGTCYIINGGSIEGCDENGDGWVEFRGVATGVYTVTETRVPAGYTKVDDFTIVVPPWGHQSFVVRHGPRSTSQLPGSELVDVSVVSRDAETGEFLTGACYIIEPWSNEGCDENGDGKVDFQDIPHGRYVLVETRAPAGYLPVLGLAPLISQPLGGGIQTLYVDHERE